MQLHLHKLATCLDHYLRCITSMIYYNILFEAIRSVIKFLSENLQICYSHTTKKSGKEASPEYKREA